MMKNKVLSTQNASHYHWGDNCDGWWLKNTGNFTVISEMMPPGTAEKKHLHQHTEQFFYCLDGSILIQFNDVEYTLSRQEGLSIPVGTPHKIINTSNVTANFLVVSSPNSHEDRIDLE